MWFEEDNVELGDDWSDEWDDEWGIDSKSKFCIFGFVEFVVGNCFFCDMVIVFGS